ncbi:MAG: 3D domain-containing protein [Nitrososphaeraceae archaeon]
MSIIQGHALSEVSTKRQRQETVTLLIRNKFLATSIYTITRKDGFFIRSTNGLTIRTLPSPWNTYQYRAVDTGPSIIGKHIDVYIGIGAEAEKESYRITGHGNTVCYKLKM